MPLIYQEGLLRTVSATYVSQRYVPDGRMGPGMGSLPGSVETTASGLYHYREGMRGEGTALSRGGA